MAQARRFAGSCLLPPTAWNLGKMPARSLGHFDWSPDWRWAMGVCTFSLSPISPNEQESPIHASFGSVLHMLHQQNVGIDPYLAK